MTRKRNGFFDSYGAYLGKHFIDSLTDPKYAVLTIGSDTWTRDAFARELGVTHTQAALKISRVAQELGVKNLAQLFEKVTPYELAGHPGLGVTTLYVLLKVFVARGFDVDAWYGGEAKSVVTFTTLKKRELAAEARIRKDAAKRTRARRRRNHEAAVTTVLGGTT